MASSRALVFGFGGDDVVAKVRTMTTTMIERSKMSDIQLKKMRDFVDVVAGAAVVEGKCDLWS